MFHQLFQKSSAIGQVRVPSVDPSDRIYAIGDIHGRLDLLDAMLERLSRDVGRQADDRETRFVFLGDYIDRGDHSRQVLEMLSGASQRYPRTFRFLMGNHEAALLAFLDDPIRGAKWLDWGGRQTLTSYGLSAVSRRPDEAELIAVRDMLHRGIKPHLPFLQSLKRYDVSGDVVFAHAALDPELALDAQVDAALLWGNVPSGQASGLPGKRLVHGHFDSYEPISDPERICVDTGAYYSGRLTAVRLDDAEAFLHVDVADLIP